MVGGWLASHITKMKQQTPWRGPCTIVEVVIGTDAKNISLAHCFIKGRLLHQLLHKGIASNWDSSFIIKLHCTYEARM